MSQNQLQALSGFTLIELLMAMVVIAILAAVLIPSLLNSRRHANDAAVQVAGRQLLNAMAAVEIQSNAASLCNGTSQTSAPEASSTAVAPNNGFIWVSTRANDPNATGVGLSDAITSVICVNSDTLSNIQVTLAYTGGSVASRTFTVIK